MSEPSAASRSDVTRTASPGTDERPATAAGADSGSTHAATQPVPSYEDARAELRDVVAALESGGQPLEKSLQLWQRGEELAGICQRWLQGAREHLDAAIAASEPSEQA